MFSESRRTSVVRKMERHGINTMGLFQIAVCRERQKLGNLRDIIHAGASIPKTFMLGIRDKRYEEGRAFGC
jgi:hypothetical protein